MLKAVIFLLALAASLGASAQVKKCQGPSGTFYSDKPCPSDAKTTDMKLPSSPSSGKPVKLISDVELLRRVAALCKAETTNWLSFKDPGSLQFEEDAQPSGQEATMSSKYAHAKAVRMFMRINAKNSYGGYVGFKSYICYTDQKGEKVLGYSEFLLE